MDIFKIGSLLMNRKLNKGSLAREEFFERLKTYLDAHPEHAKDAAKIIIAFNSGKINSRLDGIEEIL